MSEYTLLHYIQIHNYTNKQHVDRPANLKEYLCITDRKETWNTKNYTKISILSD